MKFTTRDKDNDRCSPGCNCAKGFSYAWWHNSCSYIVLNGQYNHPLTVLLNGQWYALPFTEVKIRPKNCFIWLLLTFTCMQIHVINYNVIIFNKCIFIICFNFCDSHFDTMHLQNFVGTEIYYLYYKKFPHWFNYWQCVLYSCEVSNLNLFLTERCNK